MSQCGICSDLFDGVERIATTPCGHVYHSKCLLRWIDVSKTCPECRKKVCRQDVVELYFNINCAGSVNPFRLSNKVDELKALLEERRIEACDLMDKNIDLRKRVADHESSISSLQQLNMKLQHDLNKYRLEVPGIRNSLLLQQQKNKELKDELLVLQDIQTVISGAQDDADEILNQAVSEAATNADLSVSRRLATCCSLVKRELRRAIDEKNNMRNEVIEVNKNLGLTCSMLRQSKSSVRDLKRRIEQLESRRNSSHGGSEYPHSYHSEPSTSRGSPRDEGSPCRFVELTPISVSADRKHKMNIVVLDKKTEKVIERSVSPEFFSPIPKRRKETDSVTSTGYNGLGGHHSIIIRAEDLPSAGTSRNFTLVPTKKKFRKL